MITVFQIASQVSFFCTPVLWTFKLSENFPLKGFVLSLYQVLFKKSFSTAKSINILAYVLHLNWAVNWLHFGSVPN